MNARGGKHTTVYQLEGGDATIRRGELPRGAAGTAKTLSIMRELARQGAGTLPVRHAAQEIVRQAGTAPHDFLGEAQALFRWVRDRVHYHRDPVTTEWLQTPRQTLLERAGDCDDKATLLASLLMSLGHPAELAFRAIGTAGRRFSHVYVVARLGGRRLALDPTRRGTPLGWEYPTPSIAGELGL